jgi:hypothetical protein
MDLLWKAAEKFMPADAGTVVRKAVKGSHKIGQ